MLSRFKMAVSSTFSGIRQFATKGSYGASAGAWVTTYAPHTVHTRKAENGQGKDIAGAYGNVS